ncbi:MAG: galactokinase [Flavobacteriaceae bacterium]
MKDFPAHFAPELRVKSPGRINLIGEHTDYNMGYVLPAAIEKRIIMEFQRNGSQKHCRLFSKNFNAYFEFDLTALAPSKVAWENYVLGVVNEITKRSEGMGGFDCVLESDLPAGSGLSSSAALECGLAYGLNQLFDLGLDKLELIKLSQRAEHTYVGTQCGIMDQFASVMGKAEHAIFLDCRSLAYEMVPIDIDPYKIILLNTKVAHNLATSEYNVRKRQCEAGIAALQERYPTVTSLRDVTEAMLLSCKQEMDEIVYRRCDFILKENERVLRMVKALRQNDLQEVGKLLYEAHEGIRRDYEVSCVESDFLVDFTKDLTGVLGARQTGGGFGGCTLNLVHGSFLDEFIAKATISYEEAFQIVLEAYEVRPSQGTFSNELGD